MKARKVALLIALFVVLLSCLEAAITDTYYRRPYAGTGDTASSPDGSNALDSTIARTIALVTHPLTDEAYFTDACVIRKVDSTDNLIKTVIGGACRYTESFPNDVSSMTFNNLEYLSFDPTGILYVFDNFDTFNYVLKVRSCSSFFFLFFFFFVADLASISLVTKKG